MYICIICNNECKICDYDYQCIECEHLEREEENESQKIIGTTKYY